MTNTTSTHPDSRITDRLARHADRIESLLTQMTLEEKSTMIHAATTFASGSVERLGVRGLMMSDGPHGVRKELTNDDFIAITNFDHRVTYLPTGTALAATWSEEMATLHGAVLGAEARARGKDVILGPGFNLMRTPLCGRNFEYFGEDPLLAARLAVAAIKAIQANDVAASAKHFACNDQELDRNAVDAIVDERTLRELHLAPFETAVKESGVLTVMGAYNRLNGDFCCEHGWLLNEILKDEWGFEGLVVSDWGGVHDTVDAALGGCDVEMGGRERGDELFFGRALRDAVADGRVPESVIDDKVRRILRVMAAVGSFDSDRSKGALNAPEHREMARRIADESLVLLKNDGILPLDKTKVSKLLVIGDCADVRHSAGGGSSAVQAWEEPTPLESLHALLGDSVGIEYIRGWPVEASGFSSIPLECLSTADQTGIKGWRAEWFGNRTFQGDPVRTSVEPTVDKVWENICGDGVSVYFHAEITVPVDGEYQLCLHGTDCVWFTIDDIQVASLWGHPGAISYIKNVHWRAGEKHRLVVASNPKGTHGETRLGWKLPGALDEETPSDIISTIADAAKRADAVLVFAGTTHHYDTEGRDRNDYLLPYGQNDIIKRITEVNAQTAVLLVSGGPVALPWVDSVGAVVQVGYAGMYAAPAMVDLLFGNCDPRGRLPFAWPHKLGDTPAHALDEYRAQRVEYKEKLCIGQRYFDTNGTSPLFALGHGLTYTSFNYSDPVVVPGETTVAGIVEVTVTNSGERAGSEVVQVYLENPYAPQPKPIRVLAGFAKIHLLKGESKRVQILVDRRTCSWWDIEKKVWQCASGEYKIHIGSSAVDFRCEGVLTIK